MAAMTSTAKQLQRQKHNTLLNAAFLSTLLVLDGLIAFFVLPLFLLLCLIVVLDGGRPLFVWSQTSWVNREAPIRIYRFRTKTLVRNESGRVLLDNERRSFLGRILVATKLDWTPQLLNRPATRLFAG